MSVQWVCLSPDSVCVLAQTHVDRHSAPPSSSSVCNRTFKHSRRAHPTARMFYTTVANLARSPSSSSLSFLRGAVTLDAETMRLAVIEHLQSCDKLLWRRTTGHSHDGIHVCTLTHTHRRSSHGQVSRRRNIEPVFAGRNWLGQMSTFSLPDTIILSLARSHADRSILMSVCARVFKLVRPHVHGRCHCLCCRLPPSASSFVAGFF